MHLQLLKDELRLDELGLDEIARLGAKKLLKKALVEEVSAYLVLPHNKMLPRS